MASNCKTVRAEVEEAGAGAWLSRDSDAHVGACAGCLEFVSEREKLRSLVGGLERVEAPGDFEFRLRARMAAAKAARPTRFSFLRPANGLASLALGAVLVASAASAYYLNRSTPDAVQPASQQPSVARTNAPAATQSTNEVVTAPAAVVEKRAGVRPAKQERRRPAAPPRAVSEPRVEVAKAPTENALEFGLTTAPVVKSTNVKLEVSSEPLRVVLRDERGTRRRLAMNPVSFGAQSPVGKRRGPAPLNVADTEGVW